MNKSKKLIFFGTEDFSSPSLLSLLWHQQWQDWPILAVVTKPDTKAGRGQTLSVPQIKQIAQRHDIEVLQPIEVSEINERLAAMKPTHGILVAYGKIIPQSTLDLFPGGIINVHPSLLPKYRGPAPIEAAILNGDKETGVSLIKLTAKMDAGPVYYQDKIWLSNKANKQSLTPRLAQMGAQSLVAKLPNIFEGTLQPKPQDDSQASYTQLLKKEDGSVDFNESAEVIDRKVRAFLGYPKTHASLGEHEIVITKARVAQDKNDGELVIQCQPGWLEIQELVAPSGRKMSGAEFLRGHKL